MSVKEMIIKFDCPQCRKEFTEDILDSFYISTSSCGCCGDSGTMIIDIKCPGCDKYIELIP